jgi:TatD DNase family protein
MNVRGAFRPEWVDFHCHVDLYPDHEAVLAACDAHRVAVLAVTTTPRAWARNRELAATSTYARVALGLHPQVIAERGHELRLWEHHLAEARYVGEIGLDAGPRFYRSLSDQERIFTHMLDACAEQGGKILTVHSVRTVGKVLAHLEASLLPDRGRVVLHWFTGTLPEAQRAVALGCYFSINRAMLEVPRLRKIVAALPSDRLLTETDGPFVSFDGRPVRPTDIQDAVAALGELLNLSIHETAERVITNFRSLTASSPP